MVFELNPNTVKILRAWASGFESPRTNATKQEAVGLEIGYGEGDRAGAGRALRGALARGRMPWDKAGRLFYLVKSTSPSTWGHLTSAMPTQQFGDACRASDMEGDRMPFMPAEAS